MNIIINVDMRETKLILKLREYIANCVKFNNISLNVKNMVLGDISFQTEESEKSEELIIFERKTISDLLASIIDGRYEEQSFRLNASSVPNHNIVYLLEGPLPRPLQITVKNNITFKTENQTICSSLFSLMYYKGFSVIRTMSLDETAFYICNSWLKITNEKKNKKRTPYYYSLTLTESRVSKEEQNEIKEKDQNEIIEEETEENEIKEKEQNEINEEENEMKKGEQENAAKRKFLLSKMDYVNVVKKVKKENVNDSNINEIMLCQIPGISTLIAKVLLDKYGTLLHLIETLKKEQLDLQKEEVEEPKENINNDKEGTTTPLLLKAKKTKKKNNKDQSDPNSLMNLTYVYNEKGQTRKISKNIIDNLYSFLIKAN